MKKKLKYKTRWIVHAYKQKKDLNYLDIFATMIKSVFYKALIRINVKKELFIHYMNVITALLYSFWIKLYMSYNLSCLK